MKLMPLHARMTVQLFLILAIIGMLSVPIAAAEIVGKWAFELRLGHQKMLGRLSINEKKDGLLTGKWCDELLSSIDFKDGVLTFTRKTKTSDQEFVMTYEGRLNGDTLQGTFSSAQGDMQVAAKRVTPLSPAVGRWDFSLRFGEESVQTALIVAQRENGVLEGKWESPRGEHEVSNVCYANGRLKFSRLTRFGEREIATTFEGILKGDTLTGKIKSNMGEIEADASRFGADLIGTWRFTTSTDQGEERIILARFLPDMSGWINFIGAEIPMDNLMFVGNNITCSWRLNYGDQNKNGEFKGTLYGKSIVATASGYWGTSKLKGKKILPLFETSSP